MKVLGLYEAADTLVGDGMIRGVSGGQKRRVTLGEMLLLPRRIKFLDAISNGLDAATTYDIVQALKFITNTAGITTVISLLQVLSPKCIFLSVPSLTFLLHTAVTGRVLQLHRRDRDGGRTDHLPRSDHQGAGVLRGAGLPLPRDHGCGGLPTGDPLARRAQVHRGSDNQHWRRSAAGHRGLGEGVERV